MKVEGSTSTTWSSNIEGFNKGRRSIVQREVALLKAKLRAMETELKDLDEVVRGYTEAT
jgi:hypothetical protein